MFGAVGGGGMMLQHLLVGLMFIFGMRTIGSFMDLELALERDNLMRAATAVMVGVSQCSVADDSCGLHVWGGQDSQSAGAGISVRCGVMAIGWNTVSVVGFFAGETSILWGGTGEHCGEGISGGSVL